MFPSKYDLILQISLDEMDGPKRLTERLLCWTDEWSDGDIHDILVGKNKRVDFEGFCAFMVHVPNSMEDYL